MVVYFDNVFRRKARYVIVFISKHYVTKPWTNQERKSVQARFLYEDTASLLPVRLDDSELPGLVPTMGFVDARTMTADALVGLILTKLAKAHLPAPTTPAIDRVPRSKQEEAFILASRPPGWEYLLFAAILLRERDALDPQLRDHALSYARPEGPALDDQEASALLSTAFRHAQEIARNLERVLTPRAQQLAFGPPGDPAQIEHLAQRLIEIYAGFLDWSSRLRGAAVPDHFDRAIEIASSFADQPIEEMRAFVDDIVTEMDQLPARLRRGEDVEIKLRLTFTIDESLMAELNRELGWLWV
jgi:TIR domain